MSKNKQCSLATREQCVERKLEQSEQYMREGIKHRAAAEKMLTRIWIYTFTGMVIGFAFGILASILGQNVGVVK